MFRQILQTEGEFVQDDYTKHPTTNPEEPHLSNKKLRLELYKGNIADAFLHWCWAIGGGLDHSKAPQGAMQPQQNKQYWV